MENGGKNEEKKLFYTVGARSSRCVTIDGAMRRRLIKDSAQMSFPRPPRNFTLALFLFDSRKAAVDLSRSLPFSPIPDTNTGKSESEIENRATKSENPSFFLSLSLFHIPSKKRDYRCTNCRRNINKTGDKNSRK